MLNTGMKDYFDLWLLSRQPELNKETLRAAIGRTFKNRKMEIEKTPIGLSDEFGNDPTKQVQWTAFLNFGCFSKRFFSRTISIENEVVRNRVDMKPVRYLFGEIESGCVSCDRSLDRGASGRRPTLSHFGDLPRN